MQNLDLRTSHIGELVVIPSNEVELVHIAIACRIYPYLL